VHRDVSLGILKRINKYYGDIITTDQVCMEFLKNRQVAILDALNQMKALPAFREIPGFLHAESIVETLIKGQNEVSGLIQDLKEKVQETLKKPGDADPVFAVADGLFANINPNLNLKRPSPAGHPWGGVT